MRGALGKYRPTLVSTTWDPANAGPLIILTNGNLDASNLTGAWSSVGAIKSRNAGKYKFECSLQFKDPIISYILIGVSTVTNPMNTFLGANSTSWGLQNQDDPGPSYRFYHNGSFTDVSAGSPASLPWLVGQAIMVAVDLTTGRGWTKKSDATGWMGGGDPDADTTPTFTFTGGTTLIPACSMDITNTPPNGVIRINSAGGFLTTGANTFSAWGV